MDRNLGLSLQQEVRSSVEHCGKGKNDACIAEYSTQASRPSVHSAARESKLNLGGRLPRPTAREPSGSQKKELTIINLQRGVRVNWGVEV
jgi:hypothetical protein